jgi:WD40 repeat protein
VLYPWSARPVSFSVDPSGHYLVAGLENGNIFIANLKHDASEKNMTGTYEFKAHSGAVEKLVFAPDGRHFASSGSDKKVRIYNMDVWTGMVGNDKTQGKGNSYELEKRSFVISDLSSKVKSMMFLDDGTLVVGSTDKKIRFYELDPKKLAEEINTKLSRNFTQAEWQRFFTGLPYQKTRSDLP